MPALAAAAAQQLRLPSAGRPIVAWGAFVPSDDTRHKQGLNLIQSLIQRQHGFGHRDFTRLAAGPMAFHLLLQMSQAIINALQARGKGDQASAAFIQAQTGGFQPSRCLRLRDWLTKSRSRLLQGFSPSGHRFNRGLAGQRLHRPFNLRDLSMR